ncbi:MAG: xanthine dehydrogenase family protein subunit M [Polyangiaceae bacterium]|jgi:carbon-monoxide dehydrogenase medium subunit|nr:xanthine dehydrogenase family protein subunit M [Polyangiaceae bacterium]
MEIPTLQYHRPASLRQACLLASQLGADARLLAGGTDLLIDLKQGRLQLQHLVSLEAIGELKRIFASDTELRIGALVSLSAVADASLVHTHAPALAEAILTMAAVQIRNRATLGGNFCAAVPCADTPPVCIAYDARLRLVSAAGERIVPADSFFLTPRRCVLEPGEVLAEVLLPLHRPHSGAAYARFSRRRFMSLAVAGVAACVDVSAGLIRSARVAMTSVAPTPILSPQASAVLVGREPSQSIIAAAARAAASEARPISDLRGSASYRRDLVEVLATRAIRTAIARATDDLPPPAR